MGRSKTSLLHLNHPEDEMEVFSNSAHSPFRDEPEKFFSILKSFTESLNEPDNADISRWNTYLKNWKAKLESSLEFNLRNLGWGKKRTKK